MRKTPVFAIMGYILLMFSITFSIPIITALIYEEPSALIYKAYLVPMLLSACLGGVMWFNARNRMEDLRERDAFVVVGVGWLLIAALGALPYLFSGAISSPLEAYFESMSGFTTTGATILNVAPGQDFLDVFPHSILMWRAVTSWLGGMGIIVFSVVILARFLEGGLHLFKAEVSGSSVTRLRPKLHQTARILWGVYGLFTIISFVLLMVAGLSPFDSICTSFSTLSTGGFSVHADNIGFYGSSFVEIIVIIFMIIGATNFVLHYKLITLKFREVLRDSELRFFVIWLVSIATISVLALGFSGDFDFPDALRNGIFQTVSAGTTSGFSTRADIFDWPPVVHILLIILMLFGATLGSTSGGLKASRLLILLKKTRIGILKAIHPRAVINVKVGGKTIPNDVVERVQMLFFSFILILCVAIVIICATGVSILDSLSAVSSCLANAGLGIFGPESGYHTLNSLSKTVLIFCMWIGRLEIFTGLIILAPSTYRD